MSRRVLALLGAGLVLAALTGCGLGESARGRISGTTLRIYLSAPLTGDSSTPARAAVNGAEMALASARSHIGRYRVVLAQLDDSTPQADGWDPNQTTLDARIAAQDPSTVAFIGDFDSGASAISIPILNHAGIAQVSPDSDAVGLTSSGPGASPGEPEKYYPSGVRTFARVVPSDAVEASAAVQIQEALGCRSPFVLQDGQVDGEDDAISYVLAAQAAGLHVLGVQSFVRGAPDYTSLAASVAQAGADCVLLDATDERSASILCAQLVRAMPRTTILAASSLADPAFTDPSRGGLPASLESHVLILSPALPASYYPPSGQAFLARYGRLYGPAPPAAIFGFEAMSLVLRAIAQATDHGRRAPERARVVADLFAIRRWNSPLGRVSVQPDGDISTRSYGVYRVVRGHLSFWEKIG